MIQLTKNINFKCSFFIHKIIVFDDLPLTQEYLMTKTD